MAIRLPRSVKVLRHRDYALVQAGNAVSNLGTWMQYVGIGWALRGLTGWEFALGLSFVAQFGPSLVLAPSAGVLADRFDRRRIVIVGTIAQSLPPLATAILITQDRLTIAWLLCLATLGGIGQAVVLPAGSAIIPRLVPPNDAHQAVTFGSAAVNMTRVVGPAIGGAAIHFWGLDWAFYLNGISFFGVVAAWWFVRPARTRVTDAERNARGSLREGIAYARRDHLVRHLLLLNMVVGVFMVHAPLMPAFARDVLHGDSWTYSVLTSATGIGAVLGALSAGELRGERQRWRAIVASSLVIPTALVLFASSTALILSVVALVGFGVSFFLLLATSQSMLVIATPDNYRGRVMGLFGMSSVGGVPFAGLLGGATAGLVGPRPTVAIAAGLILIYAVWFAIAERGATTQFGATNPAEG
jgi:MFS family permease